MIKNDSSERLVAPKVHSGEKSLDLALRPQTLAEYIGQPKIKENLAIFLEAARKREESIEHVLLYGPPGLGKTTLAHVIAKELGTNIKITSGPAIERAGDLASILTNLKDKDILFIDEIHRLNRVVEEALYPAMEDRALDIVLGKGPGAKCLRLDLPNFTLVGATTRAGSLSSPLRNRFGLSFHLSFYRLTEIEEILQRSARILKIKYQSTGLNTIARRARANPRIANRLLKRVRDFAEVKARGVINQEVAKKALTMLEIDERGLDQVDRHLLAIVIDKFAGGPVGLGTLAASLSEEQETIEDMYEPFLMQEGLIARTPRGRIATAAAYTHLGRKANRQQQAVFKAV